MTRTDFLALVTSIRAEQDKLLSEKGADYTQQSEDVLSNFKVVAEQTGQTPLEVWSVYAAKHWLAIMSYVKNGAVKSEPITGRFRDLGNYLLLGEGLLVPRGQGNLPHHHHCACVGARKPPMPNALNVLALWCLHARVGCVLFVVGVRFVMNLPCGNT